MSPETDTSAPTRKDALKSVADAQTSEYVGDETAANLLAFAEDETVRDESQRCQWLELRVNVVLFPFGEYKTDDFARGVFHPYTACERITLRD